MVRQGGMSAGQGEGADDARPAGEEGVETADDGEERARAVGDDHEGSADGAVADAGAAPDAAEPPAPPPADPGPPPPASVPLPAPAYSPKISPAAEITDVLPDHGPTIGGTPVTIAGMNLFRESIVRFGGEIARTTGAQEPRQLKVEAPPSKVRGPVDVTVQNPGAELAVVERAFRYDKLPPPVISTVAPNRMGIQGGELSITGKGFLRETVVLLDGVAASSVAFIDATTLEVRAPGGESGSYVDVTVRNPDEAQAVARRAFVYDERYG